MPHQPEILDRSSRTSYIPVSRNGASNTAAIAAGPRRGKIQKISKDPCFSRGFKRISMPLWRATRRHGRGWRSRSAIPGSMLCCFSGQPRAVAPAPVPAGAHRFAARPVADRHRDSSGRQHRPALRDRSRPRRGDRRDRRDRRRRHPLPGRDPGRHRAFGRFAQRKSTSSAIRR